MYIYTHTHIYIHLYTHTYINIYTYTYIYICSYIYTHTLHIYILTYIYIYVHIYSCIHIYIYIYSCTQLYIHLYASIYPYIHKYSYIYIYTYMYTTHTPPARLHTAMQALSPHCSPHTNTIHTRIPSAYTPHIAHNSTHHYTHTAHIKCVQTSYISILNPKQALYRALLPCIQHHRLQPCSATINDRHATLKLERTVDRHTLNLLQSLIHDTQLKQRPYRHKCISPPHMQLLDMPCSSSNRTCNQVYTETGKIHSYKHKTSQVNTT